MWYSIFFYLSKCIGIGRPGGLQTTKCLVHLGSSYRSTAQFWTLYPHKHNKCCTTVMTAYFKNFCYFLNDSHWGSEWHWRLTTIKPKINSCNVLAEIIWETTAIWECHTQSPTLEVPQYLIWPDNFSDPSTAYEQMWHKNSSLSRKN